MNRKEQEVAALKQVMEIADGVHPSIKVTGDIPSNYEDGRLPSLDLKV